MELDSICLKILTTRMHVLSGLKSKFIDKQIPTEVKLLENAGPQLQDILDQFHEVSMGRQQLNLFYLGDSYVIKLWKLAFDMYSRTFLMTAGDMEKVVETLIHGATKVANALLDAAKKGTLSRESEATIKERWTLLDALFCGLLNAHKVLGIKKPRLVFTWCVSTLLMFVIAAF